VSGIDTSAEAVERLEACARKLGAERWTMYCGDEDRPIAVVTYDPQPGNRHQVVLHPLYPMHHGNALKRTEYVAAAHPFAVLALFAERDAAMSAESSAKRRALEILKERNAARAEAERLREALRAISRRTIREPTESGYRVAEAPEAAIARAALAQKEHGQ
jgi:hypothetical protein